MKGVAVEVQECHVFVRHLDAWPIGASVQFGVQVKSRFGCRSGDEVHDYRVVEQRLAAPILGDEGEQAVLDLVPLAGAGGQVANADRQPGFISQFLQLQFPKPDARSIAAAGISGDQQACRRLCRRDPASLRRRFVCLLDSGAKSGGAESGEGDPL